MRQDLELPGGRVVSWCAEHGDARVGRERLVFLRNRPVVELLRLWDDGGAEVDVAGYAVWDRAFLGPRELGGGCGGGGGCWDPCGMTVEYRWGVRPPVLGKLAVAALAEQFVKAVVCPEECRLPERITSVSRQGVSFQVFDPQDFMNEGRVGIYSVDMFLKSVNPDRAQKRARVWSPDMPQGRSRTWPRQPGPRAVGRGW